MTDAERWRDFRHAAAEALDAAGIDGASRVVMNLPMPPTPPVADDAAFVDAAFEAAVDRMDEASSRLAILCATGALEGPEFRAADDALTTARARVLALHAAAVQAAEAAGYARAMRECSIAEMVDAGFTEADAAADVDARLARAAERAPTPPAPRFNDTTTTGTAADGVVVNALVNGGPPTDALDDGR